MSESKPYTEAELLQGLQAHDEQAFGFLYDHYSKALFSVIFQIVPQQVAAEDILQEVFLKIWQNIRAYDPGKGRLYTWMLNIARNQAIDRTRSRQFNNHSKTTTLTEDVYTGAVSSTIDDVGLQKTISTLPAENRRLLELAYFQGYTQEEIAGILQIPLGTVKTRIRATIIQLRKLIGVKHS